MELNPQRVTLHIDELVIDEAMLRDPALPDHLAKRIDSAAGTDTPLRMEPVGRAIADSLAASQRGAR